MKTSIRSLPGLLLSLCMLASCSDHAERITIHWAVAEKYQSLSTEIAQGFMDVNPHIVVDIIPMPPELTNIETDPVPFLAKAGIDMFTLSGEQAHWLNTYRELLLMADNQLTINKNDFFHTIVNFCSYDPHTFSAAPWLVDTSALFMNTSIIDDIQLSPPKTWDELVQTVEQGKKTNKGIQGVLMHDASDFALAQLFTETVWSHGLDIMTVDNHALLYLPQIIQILENWRTYLKKSVFPKDILKRKETDSLKSFLDNKSLFYYGRVSEWPYIQEHSNTPIQSFTMDAIPGFNSYPTASILYPTVLAGYAHTIHPQEVIDIINFCISPESQQVVLMNDFIPSMIKVFEDTEIIEYKPGFENIPTIIQSARVFPYDRLNHKIMRVLEANLINIFTKNLDIDSAIFSLNNTISNLPSTPVINAYPPKKTLKKQYKLKKEPVNKTLIPHTTNYKETISTHTSQALPESTSSHININKEE
ncbi:MAG: extracellular solute-binding protein [Elusimicrobia bacterium]|nr:extracellular solute-binding protein [Elusimicrobiota bacterium]